MTRRLVPMTVLGWTLLRVLGGASPLHAQSVYADFQKRLQTRDIVFEGTIAEIDTVSRGSAGSCGGVDGFAGLKGLGITAAVDRMWLGAAEDSIVSLTTITIPGKGPTVGDRILAWGTRSCDDNWRIWGWYCGIDAQDRLVCPYEDGPIRSVRGKPGAAIDDIHALVTRTGP